MSEKKSTTTKKTTKKTGKAPVKKQVKAQTIVEPKVQEKRVEKTGMSELRKRQILFISGILLLVLVLCFGFTYVWIMMNEKEEAKRPKTGILNITVNDSTTSSLVMENPYPMNEAGGLSTDPYKLTLKNKGQYRMNYALVLKEDEAAVKKCSEDNGGLSCKTVSIDSIRYSIKKNGGIVSTGSLKDSKGVIDMGIMEPTSDEVDTRADYELKLWVDYDTKEDLTQAKFYGRVDVLVQVGE